MKLKKLSIASLAGLTLGVLAAVPAMKNNVNVTYAAEGSYNLVKTMDAGGTLTNVAYMNSTAGDYILLATAFGSDLLAEANQAAENAKVKAKLGYVINGADYANDTYYTAINTNTGAGVKTYTAEDIFGSAEKDKMIVLEIAAADYAKVYNVEAYVKVGEEVLASKTRTFTYPTYVPVSQQLGLLGSSHHIVTGGEISGLNFAPSASSPYHANQVIKIGYAITMDHIAATGSMSFKPLIMRDTGAGIITTYSGSVDMAYSNLHKIGGKVLISFVMQLPADFDSTKDYICPRLWFNDDVDGILAGIFAHSDGFDYATMSEWIYAGETKIATGDLAVDGAYVPSTNPAPYTPDSSIYWQVSSTASITKGVYIQGLNQAPSATNPLRAGQVVKVCYCINFTSLASSGTVTFLPLQQRSSQQFATTGDTSVTINYSDIANKSGKVVLSFVVQLSAQYDPTDDYIVPRLVFNDDVTAQLDWIYIMGDAYNCGAFPQYAYGAEAVAKTSTMIVTNRYTPSVVA